MGWLNRSNIFLIFTLLLGCLYGVLLGMFVIGLSRNNNFYVGNQVFRLSIYLCIFTSLFILKIISAIIIKKRDPKLKEFFKMMILVDTSGAFIASYFFDSPIPIFIFAIYHILSQYYFIPRIHEK